LKKLPLQSRNSSLEKFGKIFFKNIPLTLTNINFINKTGANLHVTILESTIAIENCTFFVTGGKTRRLESNLGTQDANI